MVTVIAIPGTFFFFAARTTYLYSDSVNGGSGEMEVRLLLHVYTFKIKNYLDFVAKCAANPIMILTTEGGGRGEWRATLSVFAILVSISLFLEHY